MSTQSGTILVVGATGSIGTLVTAEAASRGYRVRALARPGADTSAFGDGVEVVHGDLTDSATLGDAVDGIDAVIFTHGAHQGSLAEKVDYGGVHNVLTALHGRPVRIALMTAIGVTKRSEGHDWKRRAERLVRASELPYTIVRPGWFDYNQPTEQRIRMLQGDRRWASDPSDGVISRQQIAEVLVTALATPHAQHKTLELVAEQGAAPHDLSPLFAALETDPATSLDGVHDTNNLPLPQEPSHVHDDLAALRRPRRSARTTHG